MSTEQIDEFMASFSTLDLTNTADWKKIPELFKQVGMTLPNE
jgi:hypothetical protein